jgi:hypothetical protein
MALLALPGGVAQADHGKLALESMGPAGGNGSLPADLAGPLDAGERVFISTPEVLTSADTDSSFDLYSRTGGTTALLSAGSPGGNGAFPASFGRAAAAGSRVFFQSDERLSTQDTDNSLDVYMREGSATTLISTGPGAGAFGPFDSYFAGTSTDGTRVFFITRGALIGADSDQSFDVYERSGSATSLVSTGTTGGNGGNGAEFVGAADDGTKVFFQTAEGLVAGDTDGQQDVYQRSGGATTLVSTGPAGGNGAHLASYDSVSQDGSRVIFHTPESLVAGDTDQRSDVYERAGGVTTLLSIGSAGGNGSIAANFAGATQDATTVFLETQEQLVTADNDSTNDVYRSAGGTVTLLSAGWNDTAATNAYLVGASADGSKVFIRSEESLASGDTDKYQDIYEYSGGALTRLSRGPTAGNGAAHAFFGGASADGTRVVFTTYESLDPSDTDTTADVYERYAGTTYLLSTGTGGGNGAFDATVRAVSADGKRVFFRTAESLLSADTDSAADVYSSNVAGTITVKLDAIPDDAQNFSFQAMLDDGPAAFTLDDDLDPAFSNQQVFAAVAPGSGYSISQAAVSGWDLTASCDDGSAVNAIGVSPGENVTCTFTDQRQVVLTGYPRPIGATPARFSLVPAYLQCTVPNRTHGPSLNFPSCNPPARDSAQLTVGTQDANGAAPNFVGSVKFETIVGNPGTPADEADVRLQVNLGDVRLAANLADYTGELDGAVVLKITDRGGGVPITMQEFPFRFAVPCSATTSSSVGSTCTLATTADALIPAAVKETQRSIWELGQVQVNDGGPDGNAATEPNAPFARQGLFVP